MARVIVLALCLSALRVFGDDSIGKIEDLTGTATAQDAAGASRELAKDGPSVAY